MQVLFSVLFILIFIFIVLFVGGVVHGGHLFPLVVEDRSPVDDGAGRQVPCGGVVPLGQAGCAVGREVGWAGDEGAKVAGKVLIFLYHFHDDYF